METSLFIKGKTLTIQDVSQDWFLRFCLVLFVIDSTNKDVWSSIYVFNILLNILPWHIASGVVCDRVCFVNLSILSLTSKASSYIGFYNQILVIRTVIIMVFLSSINCVICVVYCDKMMVRPNGKVSKQNVLN